MNNVDIAEVVEQTALLLSYREGASFFTDELREMARLLRLFEIPLENYASLDLGNKHEVQELESMLEYWRQSFSPDAVWNLREIILTGSNPIRDKLLNETSPSVIRLMKIKSLPIEAIGFIRSSLGIRNVEQLKQACRSSVLSQSNAFTEQEELDIFEDIVKIEKSVSTKVDPVSDEPSGGEILAYFRAESFDVYDSETMFWANADALADVILASLQEELKTKTTKLVGDLDVKDTIFEVRDHALGVVGRFKRFFTSRSDPRYRQMLEEAEERTREQMQRRAVAEMATQRESAVNASLEIVKVGAVRRCEPATAQLDFLIKTDDTEIAFERVKKSRFVKEVLVEQGRRLTVSLRPDFFTLPYNKRLTPPATLNFYTASELTFGTVETLLTSSRDHWQRLTNLAENKGWNLTPLGLYNGMHRISSRTSERLYNKLDLPYVPVELRDESVVQRWIDDGSPELVRIEDIRSDLHIHSTFSDGTDEIPEIVARARSLGYGFIALTDHTKNCAVGNGMTEGETLNAWEVVDSINDEMKRAGISFVILKGAEVDILEKGGLDFSDETLSQADWIVASIHFGKIQSQSQLHRRYMDAFQNPYVDVIAHPTQRVIGLDPPMEVDIDFLCENALKFGKFLELNAQPRRLDLDSKYLIKAKEYGVPVVINTDAHAANQLEYIRFGVQQARRAGFTRGDVLNVSNLEVFLKRRRAFKSGVPLENNK